MLIDRSYRGAGRRRFCALCFVCVCGWSFFFYSLSPLASSLQDVEVIRLIDNLWSEETSIREESSRRLVQMAERSQTARESIIRELLRAVEKESELDGSHPILHKTLLFWETATHIFSKLKALEATILVRCIHCGNGYHGRMGEPPASIALVRLGKPVLSKLNLALSSEKNRDRRIDIVICVSRIGGPQAKPS